MSQPSTTWQENNQPDDDARYARFADVIGRIQQKSNEKQGKGRALHRKQVLGMRGELEVLGDLPDYARYGLFAQPARYEAWVRISNGGLEKSSDRVPDIRGFAIKVNGLQGEASLGGQTSSQDFLLINRPTFDLKPTDAFIEVTEAVSRGIPALAWYMIRKYGFFAGISQLIALDKGLKKPFSGFSTEMFFSAAPICCGPYAMKVRLSPENGEKPVEKVDDYHKQFMDHLAKTDLNFTLEGQFFVDEQQTPIEDASVNWTVPFVPLARLRLTAEGVRAELASAVEAAHFDPWGGLMAHRPLGDVMRARKVAYFRSQNQRK